MDTNYAIAVEQIPDPGDVQFVRAQLTAFNRARAADDRYQPLVILARGADGRIVGGLVGGTYWGWLYTESCGSKKACAVEGAANCYWPLPKQRPSGATANTLTSTH